MTQTKVAKAESDLTKRLNLRLTPEMHKRVRREALERNTSAQALAIELLRRGLARLSRSAEPADSR